MSDSVFDPATLCRQRQAPRRVAMEPEGETPDTFRQRHRIVRMRSRGEITFCAIAAQISVRQILDSRTADPAQAREWRGVGTDPKQKIGARTGAFQRRAEMRRSEEDKIVELPRPRVRATSPPMLWPTIANRSIGCGHSRISAFTRSANWRPLSPMCSPVL